jgi:hypothetical protein
MIRFIDLGDQIYCDDDVRTFSWFNTITIDFMRFNDKVIFNSWKEFEEAYNRDYIPEMEVRQPIERFKQLFPDDF